MSFIKDLMKRWKVSSFDEAKAYYNQLVEEAIHLDLETAGKYADKHEILALGYSLGRKKDSVRAILAEQQTATEDLAPFVRQTILPGTEATARARQLTKVSEEQALYMLLDVLEANPDRALVGWNIGYEISASAKQGFDIPYLLKRAQRYEGLEERYLRTLKNREIIDVGREFQYGISRELTFSGIERELSYAKPLVSSAKALYETGESSVEAGLLKITKGWHQPFIHEIGGLGKVEGAHRVDVDIESLIDMTSPEFMESFFSNFNAQSYTRELLVPGGVYSRIKAENAALEVEEFRSALDRANELLRNKGQRRPKRVEEGSKTGLGTAERREAIAQGEQSVLALAGAFTFAGIISNALFSGFDDSYNTIEGLPHGGTAQQQRRQITDFGSGYQGPNVSNSIHGQVISPVISQFRKKWFDSNREKELEQRKQSIGNQYSKLQWDEYSEGITGLAEINTSAFHIKWEDADTLVLQSNSLIDKLMGRKDVAIRLAGIDAPEIAHPGDPTEWFRHRQAQPWGEEARKLAEGFAGDDIRVVVDPDQMTYGRYIGLVYRQGEDVPFNVEMARTGIVAALPFGEAGSDIYPREEFMEAERLAIQEKRGMWQDPFFQKYLGLSKGLGGRITFNTLTDLTRMGKNYHLAAAHEALWDPEASYHQAHYIGRKLIPSYGRFFSGKDDDYNVIEGLRHGGLSSVLRKANTDFGSGYRGLLKAGKKGKTVYQKSSKFGSVSRQESMAYREAADIASEPTWLDTFQPKWDREERWYLNENQRERAKDLIGGIKSRQDHLAMDRSALRGEDYEPSVALGDATVKGVERQESDLEDYILSFNDLIMTREARKKQILAGIDPDKYVPKKYGVEALPPPGSKFNQDLREIQIRDRREWERRRYREREDSIRRDRELAQEKKWADAQARGRQEQEQAYQRQLQQEAEEVQKAAIDAKYSKLDPTEEHMKEFQRQLNLPNQLTAPQKTADKLARREFQDYQYWRQGSYRFKRRLELGTTRAQQQHTNNYNKRIGHTQKAGRHVGMN